MEVLTARYKESFSVI